jgi:hypothetical protein
METKRTIPSYTMYFGCDPEFFFSSKGQVLGAEKIIPENGIEYVKEVGGKKDGDFTVLYGTTSKIIIDGVQAELNPRPNTCRANLANEISCCFMKLYNEIKENKDLNIDFSQVVEISKEELDSLSEKSKTFGCAPSQNIYKQAESKISVNPAVYRFRSAGGHIHLGGDGRVLEALKKVEVMVPMLDYMLGNTCVLLDRNPWAKERRKVYGRAGEYRTPTHGLEYRTLSNFWLQSYPLMSFVMGMSRMAVCAVIDDISHNDTYWQDKILKKVEKEKIERAINENNFGLAYFNFLRLEKTITEMNSWGSASFPLSPSSMDKFKLFVRKGMKHWFKQDPLQHWLNLPEGHERGFESFLYSEVKVEKKKCVATAEKRTVVTAL